MTNLELRRWVPVALVVGAAAFLPFLAHNALASRQSALEAEARMAQVQRESAELSRARAQLTAVEEFQTSVAGLMQEARTAGLAPGDWVAGQVDIRQRNLSRREAAGFLSGAGRLPGYFFIPETFELRTARPSDDLFSFDRGDVDRVELTLRGSYYSQARQ